MKITEEIVLNHNLTLEEYDKIKLILGREPTITELGMYSVLWSEHCSYKSSKVFLRELPSSGEQVIQGPGENAGAIDIGDGLAIVMKVESHNHPSAIEPYQGAATGVGGILRDIFTMGARPIAIMNSLRFGSYTMPRTRYLLSGVVEGIAGYGNCVGVPTVGGEVYFDDCYNDNPLVNVMCVGIIRKKNLIKAVASGISNPVIYAGATTGRDGVKGAAFASKGLSDKSKEDRPAVQVGDPFLEKLLIEACLELSHKDYLVGMQDMGAAGLTSSSAEMAGKSNLGMSLNLDFVPQRDKSLTSYEMMLSESQERMLIIVKSGYENDAISIFHKWGLEACVIGSVESNSMLRVTHNNEVVAEVPARSLSDDAPVYSRPYEKPDYQDKVNNLMLGDIPTVDDFNLTLLELLSVPTIASKYNIFQQYDYMVGTNTIISPGEGDGAVMRIRGTNKAIAISIDGNSRYCYLDPFTGSQIAVAEAARNVVSTGAKPLAITDGLNFGNPENKGVMWQFQQSVIGIKSACEGLNTPVISGNVSFYNDTNGSSIYPTPIIGMLGIIDDLNYITTIGFKKADDAIFLLGDTLEEFGGSEYLKLTANKVTGHCPVLDLGLERLIQDTCQLLISSGFINSAHDVSDGGLAIALAECCIKGDIGASVYFGDTGLSDRALLFSESQSRIIISASPGNIYEVITYLEYKEVPYTQIGIVVNEKQLKIDNLVNLAIKELRNSWNSLEV